MPVFEAFSDLFSLATQVRATDIFSLSPQASQICNFEAFPDIFSLFPVISPTLFSLIHGVNHTCICNILYLFSLVHVVNPTFICSIL